MLNYRTKNNLNLITKKCRDLTTKSKGLSEFLLISELLSKRITRRKGLRLCEPGLR